MQTLTPPGIPRTIAPSLYDAALADPTAFGLPAGIFLPLADDDADEDGDEEVGEPPNAHIADYRLHQEREEHLAALYGGLNRIRSHLASRSPGCTRMGFSEEGCHVRHLWADEAELLAWAAETPFAPADEPPFPAAMGYPYCTLPWYGWPPLLGHEKPHLFLFDLRLAEADVTAQIAACNGLDDWRGWIFRWDEAPTLKGLELWLDRLFLAPSELAAMKKAGERTRKTSGQKEKRAKVRKDAERLSREDATPPASGKGGLRRARSSRPISLTGDGKAIVTLTQGYSAIINAADVPLVEGYNWCAAVEAGKRPFAMRTEKGAGGRSRGTVRMHNIEGLTGPVEIRPPPTAWVPPPTAPLAAA